MTVIISGVTGLVLDCIYEQFILISYKYNIETTTLVSILVFYLFAYIISKFNTETTTLVSILVFYCLISNIIWTKNKLKSKTDK